MIVADVNLIAYLWISGEMTELTERALRKDSEWAAPQLWKSEFRNVLAHYYRKGLIDQALMARCVQGAESMVRAYSIPSSLVLNKVIQSNCSAYDCEYVALAESLNVQCVTADKKLCSQFPDLTVNLRQFVK